MIKLKNNIELELMRDAGKITAEALMVAKELVKPGVNLLQIDREIKHTIEKYGATPSFLGYGGFPASACISLNQEVIHGIPDKRELKEGDVVKIDVGAFYKGYNGDAARTFFCGEVDERAVKLERITRESFFEGIKYASIGNRLGDLSHAIEMHVVNNGFSVVKQYVGHGIGRELHEDPEVPNYGKPSRGPRFYEGMTIAVEPMVNEGTELVEVLDNDWTVVTLDGKLSAHYENTIAIGENGPEILTATE